MVQHHAKMSESARFCSMTLRKITGSVMELFMKIHFEVVKTQSVMKAWAL
jgi:hypothetical protein